jgi:hypothetical protein
MLFYRLDKLPLNGYYLHKENNMGINIFWDNSNVWLVGRNVCLQRESGHEYEFRIHFRNLIQFVANGRHVDYAFAAGSVPPPNDEVWSWFHKLNIRIETQERSVSGGEVAVDEIIQLAMANRVLDIHPNHEEFVLLTGDGAGFNEGKGFIKQLERILNLGNKIAVVSWDLGCNRHLKEFASANGIYRSLESVYDNVTFINNVRWAKNINV